MKSARAAAMRRSAAESVPITAVSAAEGTPGRAGGTGGWAGAAVG
ncbi:hypothetical protein [Paractinoplanes durhamensis]